MKNGKLIFLLVAVAAVAAPADDGFRIGADIGWVTQLEKEGRVFVDAKGAKRDCFDLMKDYGVDAIRLRVWVDPKDGWNGKVDTLAKAKRARAAGQDVMIDFHYADSWADPGKQPMPAAWRDRPVEEVERLLAAHTRDVLGCLKANGVEPKWVQVGNETTNGFLWDLAHIDRHPENYARLFRAGYEAVKAVLPQATVIVHVDQGHRPDVTERNLGVLAKNGAKWDMVGFSVYPYHARPGAVRRDPVKIPPFDADVIANAVANCVRTAKKWKCPVMIVETGFETVPVAPLTVEYSRTLMERLVREAREHTEGLCKGVFYWEPACPKKWYPLGAFLEDGKKLRPTAIMDAFRTGRDRVEVREGMPTSGLCSHQGVTTDFPGNTVESLTRAVEAGAAMIEFDVKRCATGELFLHHDATLKLPDGKTVTLANLTLAELRRIDKRGCRIPTLAEALAGVPKTGIWLDCHCAAEVTEDVALFLRREGRLGQAFLAAPVEAIARARKLVPEVKGANMSTPEPAWRHFWTRNEVKRYLQTAIDSRCDFVQAHMTRFVPEDTAAFRARGGRINYYVCNDPLRLEPLLEQGVAFPLTDRFMTMQVQLRAVRRAKERAPLETAATVKLRLARGERAEISVNGAVAKGDFGPLVNADGVVFPSGAVAVCDGVLKVSCPTNMPAGFYRGRGLTVRVNTFGVPTDTPTYAGPTDDPRPLEAYAKVLEAQLAKVDQRQYPNWNWFPCAKSVTDRIRARREGLRYGFTDDPDEYDYWREALADLNDGNCRY